MLHRLLNIEHPCGDKKSNLLLRRIPTNWFVGHGNILLLTYKTNPPAELKRSFLTDMKVVFLSYVAFGCGHSKFVEQLSLWAFLFLPLCGTVYGSMLFKLFFFKLKDLGFHFCFVFLGGLQELQDGIGQRQIVVKTLNTTGEEIIQQSSKTDANILQEKLESLSLRWHEICTQLSERKKR